MPSLRTTLTDYESRSAGDGVIHKFKTSDGKKFQTWKQEIADDAKPYVDSGEEVVIDYESKENNRSGRVYTDNYINGVEPADGASAPVASTGDSVAYSGAQDRLAALSIVISVVGAEEVSEDFDKAFALADSILEWADTGDSPFAE